VSFETSFDSKQPKLEPKLASALSETKHLFRLFCFYTETESFDVSIESKQTEDPPKQFKRKYIWVLFRQFRVGPVCFGLFRFVSVCFGLFRFVTKQTCLFRLFLYRFEQTEFFCFCYTKQTETNAKQILFRFVSVRTKIYFCLFRGHPTQLRG
jgi:hypothetical protein